MNKAAQSSSEDSKMYSRFSKCVLVMFLIWVGVSGCGRDISSVDIGYPQPCRYEIDSGNDGTIDWTDTTWFDEKGQVVALTVEEGTTLKRTYNYSYDDKGNLVKMSYGSGTRTGIFIDEYDWDENGMIAHRGIYNGELALEKSYEYIEGNLAFERTDSDGDGQWDHLVYHQYNISGQIIRTSTDLELDDEWDIIQTYHYEKMRLTLMDIVWKDENTLTCKYTYYSGTRPFEEICFNENNTITKQVIYDEEGQVTKDFTLSKSTYYKYDEEGRVIEKLIDYSFDFDGYYELIETTAFDEQGRVIKREVRGADAPLSEGPDSAYHFDEYWSYSDGEIQKTRTRGGSKEIIFAIITLKFDGEGRIISEEFIDHSGNRSDVLHRYYYTSSECYR